MQMSAKQLRWQDILVLINVDLIHKLDHDNVMHDVLSKREEFQAMGTIQTLWLMYKGERELQCMIRTGYMNDLEAQRFFMSFARARHSRRSNWWTDWSCNTLLHQENPHYHGHKKDLKLAP